MLSVASVFAEAVALDLFNMALGPACADARVASTVLVHRGS